MYRVMIIDDEASARRLLKASVDWAALGMEVVGEAENGIEAINIIDDIQPQIAFVDITMPFMDGIEFTKIANERYPDLVIVILTAFDEFEYARQFIKLKIFEYVLKPISRPEITKVAKDIMTMLDERKEEIVYPTKKMELSTIEKIMVYLKKNYTDSTINLTSVAQKFGFSASYLSRKFKAETGKSFVDYLTEIRITKAKELAVKGEKMFVAANLVGVPDPNYFGRCFKKYTGINYTAYTNKGQKEDQKEENGKN